RGNEDALRFFFCDFKLLPPQKDISSHLARDPRKKTSVGCEETQANVSLRTRAHQRGARSLPGEANNVFQIVQWQPRRRVLIFLFFNDDVFPIQREIGFRCGDVENVTEFFHKFLLTAKSAKGAKNKKSFFLAILADFAVQPSLLP